MKSKPLVTLYIPCRNYGKYLTQCINSVINQVYENWELIIINEGSSDDTIEIINKFQKKFPEKVNVEIVENLPYAIYIEKYNNAHILLDQVRRFHLPAQFQC